MPQHIQKILICIIINRTRRSDAVLNHTGRISLSYCVITYQIHVHKQITFDHLLHLNYIMGRVKGWGLNIQHHDFTTIFCNNNFDYNKKLKVWQVIKLKLGKRDKTY